MHPQLTEMRRAVRALLDQIDAIERSMQHVRPLHFADCITKDVPLGYDTVLGWLAKNRPDILEGFDYTNPQGTVRDGYWLSARCKERGVPNLYAAAPECLEKQGILLVRTYPVELIARRFND